MSLDRHTLSPDPLARVGIWGHPWHGLVQGGVLPLPNATTIGYPQPDTTWPDTAGSTHRLHIPGIAPVVRSPAELAADAAAGLQWRNEAMLSGGRMQLYSQPMDGWIYVDPAGVRWRVVVAGLDNEWSFAAPLATTVALHRFGDLGVPAESHAYPVSLNNWGQAGPPVYIPITDTQPLADARLLVDALKLDGSAALVMVHLRRTQSGLWSDVTVRWPLGWLELTISGPGAAATVNLAVKRDRATTLAITRAVRNAPSGDLWWAGYIKWVTSVNTSGGFSYTTDWQPWCGLAADLPPIVDPFHTQPAVGDAIEIQGALAETEESALSYSVQRPMALWYDAAGAVREVAVHITWNGSASFPPPQSVTTAGGTDFTRSIEASAEWSIGLALDGTVLDAFVGTYTLPTTTQGLSMLWPPGGGGRPLWYLLSPSEIVADVSGAALTLPMATAESAAFQWFPIGGLSSSSPYPGPDYGLATIRDNVYAGVLHLPGNALHACPEDLLATVVLQASQWRTCSDAGNVIGEIARQSPQVIGWRLFAGDSLTYRPALTPSGVYGTQTTRPCPAGGERLYASHNPYDGAVSWLNTSPVCWV